MLSGLSVHRMLVCLGVLYRVKLHTGGRGVRFSASVVSLMFSVDIL